MSDELLAALVSGVIGVVTGFVLTWYGARKRRQAERDSLRRELANSFLEKLGGASDATRKALDAQDSGLVASLSDS